MNGLLSAAANGSSQGAAMPAQSQAMTAPTSTGPKASAEDQEILNTLIGQTADYLYNNLEDVKARLSVDDDPVDDIGGLIGLLLLQNNQSAKQAGKMIPPPVMFFAAMQLCEIVSEIAIKAGIINEQDEASITEDAFFHAMTTFGEQGGEQLSEQEKQAYSQMINTMVEMEQQHGGQ
ncbi:hypothetical protein KCM76_22935 [Zooshikella marina]|uniref:hypothetical protein n=1 Tax=Zooshikella ganghwensis TaxID=202772 RepID=UPI001BAEC998|nr:hypothetical protein [Zooshikella ganghwensis]MBU2708868.1 hypothetical protein [Zooshikella ganghwensis]